MTRRLLPDSVVGRTALVLVAALALSLALAVAVFSVQRSQALTAQGADYAAFRVAGLARLMDRTDPSTRSQLLNSVGNPSFHPAWGTEPLVKDEAEDDARVGAVLAHLRADLPDHEVRGAGLPPGLTPDTGFGPVLRFSVRLGDGTWLNVFAPLHPPPPLLRPRFLVPILLSALVVAAAALLAVRRAVRPFAVFAAQASRLGVDVAAPALDEAGPREVRRAAHAFNVMQARIRRFVEDRTQMLAAISHDLRTPITRLRLRAEFVEDEAERTRMLADLDEMERMIAATLVFARDDAAREDSRPTDVAALVQGLVDDLSAQGAEAGYDGPDRLVMTIRPIALKRAVSNLLDNAVKYGRSAEIHLDAAGSEVRLAVEDRGPGIPATDRERVFSPFVRLEASRSRDTGGTGLGLSVARAAIRAHGGDIVIADRPGGGARVVVTLPLG